MIKANKKTNKKYYFNQYIWYSPEIDVFILHNVIEGTQAMHFEWDNLDLFKEIKKFGRLTDPIGKYLWFPLGEL